MRLDLIPLNTKRSLRARPLRAGALALLTLGLGVFAACASPPAASTRTATPADDFASVRATAQAAYESGRQRLEKGELEAALVDLDQARLHDPDGRADIQAALDEAVRRLRERPRPPTRTPIPTRTPEPTQTPSAATLTPQPSTGPGAPRPTVPEGYARWSDQQGRFSLAAPSAWQTQTAPPAEFGTGVVAFRDPSGQAEFSVAVDTNTQVASPELYAAKLDIAMQRIPGYAQEAIVPGLIGNTPTLRRDFSVSQRVGGRETTATGFQVAVLRGRTPYILTATAPTDQFQRFSPTFEQMLDSFAFG